MPVKNLEPKEVWKYFHDLCQIPRPSKKEEKIIAYLLAFAKDYNLQAQRDDIGNVIIRKDATPGYEDCRTVILQGHVDMVCEKNSNKHHNFDTDPIDLIIEGDWLKADNTTLGADNGIGVAASLAILASKTIEHGPLECLFTVDEETGLTGAQALENELLCGSILINLDTEEEGQFYIGCAGGRTTTATFEFIPTPPPANLSWFKVNVSGLQGGHSGADIHIGLANANKLLVRYLWELNRKIGINLSEIKGGNLHNAIAREAHAVIGLPETKNEEAIAILNELLPQILLEYKNVDPNINISIEPTHKPQHIIDNDSAKNLLNALYACPHGVISMSPDIKELVETSTNLAAIKMIDDNKIEIKTSQRSSTESRKDDIVNMVTASFLVAGASVSSSGGYPGWKPNPKSQILQIAKDTYNALYPGDEPKIMAIHAGLECGLLLEKYPYLDMISIGPTIREAHSPDEKVYIPSVKKWWIFLLELLKHIPKN